jgi:hypothetical protein
VRTIVVRLSGTPVDGDFINVCIRSPRGGRTDAAYRVVAFGTPPTLADIASSIAAEIGKMWTKEDYEASAKGHNITIHCRSAVCDVFACETEGEGTLAGTMEEF